ncbi:hypothetical protein, partial [Pseudomonas aeruginosa]|uniref:hypothetical protein n=1 Tax=Pseudomonas aeruginosa TaxID=287 RepID=UPI001FFA761D
QADLDRDALCGAEFVIGHGATPYRNGRVLHSVFAAANSFDFDVNKASILFEKNECSRQNTRICLR